MTKYEKVIIRRVENIDEVFHFWLNSNGAQHLVRSHDYLRWKEALLHDMSNYFMVEHLKIPSWDVFFNKTDEMEIIYSNLCNFIRNKYRNKMKDTYRLYRVKTNGHGF
jgi:hypothetical protein